MINKKFSDLEIIDRLFSRLAATYGTDWTRQWAGVPIADVKTAWCHELQRFMDYLPAITHALENLPERCPNVIQFRNLCRTLPAVEVIEVEAPRASPEHVAMEIKKLSKAPIKLDGKDWARRIVRCADAGGRVRPYSLNLARAALNPHALAAT